MKVLSIVLFKWKGENEAPIRIAKIEDLSSFGMFQRGAIGEHILFATRTICQRTAAGIRQSITLQDIPFLCHVHVRQDSLAGVLIADVEYPVRVAFSLLGKFMKSMDEKNTGVWQNVTKDVDLPIENMEQDFKKYQNPQEADQLIMLQKKTHETMEVMRMNMEELLKRGEKIENLVQKSEDLSFMSKTFFTTAKRNNQCCKYY